MEEVLPFTLTEVLIGSRGNRYYFIRSASINTASTDRARSMVKRLQKGRETFSSHGQNTNFTGRCPVKSMPVVMKNLELFLKQDK